jgi:hypothetical protein
LVRPFSATLSCDNELATRTRASQLKVAILSSAELVTG